jgi:RNA polymerase sigma-70 factor (ECF subfamily)
MSEPSTITTALQELLQRLAAGEPGAPQALVERTCGRLHRLTHQMLRGYPGVKRWAETDDVLQSALMRLLRALQQVRPATPKEYFALAALQIRRELLDLARHYFGPQGLGANHASNAVSDGPPAPDRPDTASEPSKLAEWCEFHRVIEDLPEQEREVVGLIYYHGLTQAEAAELLQVNIRTVQRRWHAALVRLHKYLKSGWLEG